jgi:hypothetical protein
LVYRDDERRAGLQFLMLVQECQKIVVPLHTKSKNKYNMNSEKQYVVEQLENLKGLHITAEELNNKLSAIFGVERVRFNDYGLDDPFEKLIFTIDIEDNSEIDVCGDFIVTILLLEDVDGNELLQIEDIECNFF